MGVGQKGVGGVKKKKSFLYIGERKIAFDTNWDNTSEKLLVTPFWRQIIKIQAKF